MSGGDERGAGSALVVGLVAAALLALTAVLALAHAAGAAATAATAADLAALSGADAARGLAPGDPCAVARETARRNGAQLSECRIAGSAGELVDVWTSVPLGPDWAWMRALGLEASGRARAGPPPQPWAPPVQPALPETAGD
ncbi:Rv3654c family TadE-like protein [Zafaria sp. J156]|uniref:Rv3654c family TadE-like protein n=1 Tax=Zafaria sp. J156 TaxID=3116490 RepID=UPI002E79205B|nr:Rv3654c family TadE-like protein [Zafaria sp. J156]MEE1621346.1 Rv3654c family TadE-like protein [Zafaria sp. J156]